MLTIGIKFPAGRYHATPWGRNVNEGAVEWPPSPYRFARAIVDVWKRRKPDWPPERVVPILEAFGKPAYYSLPPATAAHTRSFLSSNQTDPTAKQLIFDAFVAIDPGLVAVMGIDHNLPEKSVQDFDELLSELNYLGRSESWVTAEILRDAPLAAWNAVPVAAEADGLGGEIVQVAGLLPSSEYGQPQGGGNLDPWLEGLCMTTREFLKEGWSNPPALKWIDYVRSADALELQPMRYVGKRGPVLRCATYALSSTVLPSVKDTLPFAERIRAKLMGIHRRLMDGEHSAVSRLFSGKDQNGRPLEGHKHAYYQPIDNDGDGRIDHLRISSPEPFNESELAALDRLRSIWQPDGRPDVKFVLTSFKADHRTQLSHRWVSAPPFVTKRHYRRGRGNFDEWLMGEVVKECSYHALPAPKLIEFVPESLSGRRKLRWAEFVRSRKNSELLRGYGCIIEFDQPIPGPFSLGACCHFGLGFFKPYG